MAKQVKVGKKVDLDTAAAALLLGASREDEVEVVSGEASVEDLANPDVICIEVGGSGQCDLNNWDHHGTTGNEPSVSACMQAFFHKFSNEIVDKASQAGYSQSCIAGSWCFDTCQFDCIDSLTGQSYQLARLVHYVNKLDTEGLSALSRPDKNEGELPSFLSDVFAGMLLTERDPVEQIHLGVEILQEVVQKGINPYGRMPIGENPAWTTYAEAKSDNDQKIAEALEQAEWTVTSAGLKLASLKTDFFGAPGALYRVGAQVVVAFSPHFGPARVPKFTIAGKRKVNAVIPKLNALEPGWGGPPTGTIVGSPREGSKLTLQEVVTIVKTIL